MYLLIQDRVKKQLVLYSYNRDNVYLYLKIRARSKVCSTCRGSAPYSVLRKKVGIFTAVLRNGHCLHGVCNFLFFFIFIFFILCLFDVSTSIIKWIV